MQYGESIKYVFYVIGHPIDGFWDLKHEKRGSLLSAMLFVLGVILTMAIEKLDTGFLFNSNRLSEVNILVDVITVVLVFFLWCLANWCTTSLMDGKGRMKDIVIATGYALFPIILIRLPMVVLSRMMTLDGGTFYYILSFISYTWVILLIFIGTMMTHEYSVSKTIATCALTIIGMGIIMFIGLLFFNVISQMIAFVSTIYKEIRYR